MVLQRRKKTSLFELLESYAGRSTPEVAAQPWPPTPLPTHISPLEQIDKKRKRKGKDVFKEGGVVPSKEFEPQKGMKITKGAQRKTSAEGIGTEIVSKCRPRVPTWNPPLELDGAPLPLDSSIRDFQKGKVDYVANALEQPLLLP